MQSPWHQIEPELRRWPASQYPATAILAGVSLMLYLAQVVFDAGLPGLSQTVLGVSWTGVASGFVWQPLTYLFVYPNPVLAFFTMFLLYFLGKEVEPILGTRHFLGVIGLAGVLGGMTHAVVGQDLTGMGAWGPAVALMVVYLALLPDVDLTLRLFLVKPVSIHAKVFTGASVFVLLLMTGLQQAIWGMGAGMLVSGVLGSVYVRQLGYGAPLIFEKRAMARRALETRRERLSNRQFIQEEIDPILDKISRDGYKKLSREERRILAKASDKLSGKAPQV